MVPHIPKDGLDEGDLDSVVQTVDAAGAVEAEEDAHVYRDIVRVRLAYSH